MKNGILLATALVLATILPVTGQQSGLTEKLRHHVTILASDSLSGRGFGFPEKHLAIDYITKQYAEAGFAAPYAGSYIHQFNHNLTFALVEGKNIIGIIEGSDPQLRDEYILLGAHYDHMGWKTVNGQKVVYNGADDNATGVASVIEIGKLLIANRGSLGRSIIIAAFDGEEAGLLGSAAFVRTQIPSRFNVKMMFSLDMTGMLSTNEGLNHAGFRAIAGGEEMAAEIIQRHSIDVKNAENKIEARTDTWPFAKAGIPAVYVSTGLLSPYHKPEDDAHLIDYEGMNSIVGMMTEFTTELSVSQNLEADSRYIARKVNPALQAGFRGGYGSTSHAHTTEFFRAKPVFAAEYGPEVQVRLSGNLRLQSAVMYQFAGSRTGAGKLRTHSVVPQADMLITTKSASSADPMGFFLAGGYYSYAFAGKEAGAEADFTTKYSDSDYGIRLGGGLKIMKVQTAFVYRIGLQRINLNDADGTIYNRGFIFSTTMFF